MNASYYYQQILHKFALMVDVRSGYGSITQVSQRVYGLVLLSTVLYVPTVASHLTDSTNLPGLAKSHCVEIHLTVRCAEYPALGSFSCDPDGVP